MEAQYSNQVNAQCSERQVPTVYELYSQGSYGEDTNIEVSTYKDGSAFFRWINDGGEFAVNLYNFGTYVNLGNGEGKFVRKPEGFRENTPALYSEYNEGTIQIIVKDSSNSAGICFMSLCMSRTRLVDWGLKMDIFYNRTLLEEKRRTPNAFWTLCEKIFELHVQRNTTPDLSKFRDPTNFYKPKFLSNPNYSEKDRDQVQKEVN
jgi:hypothetical protein